MCYCNSYTIYDYSTLSNWYPSVGGSDFMSQQLLFPPPAMSWVRCHVLGQVPCPGSGAMSWVPCPGSGAVSGSGGMSWVDQVHGHFVPQISASLYMVQCLILLWAYCQLPSRLYVYMHTCITTLVDTIAKNPTVRIIIAHAQTGCRWAGPGL